MKPALNFVLLLMTVFCSTNSMGQFYNTEVAADLDLISNGEFYIIKGFAINKTDTDRSLRYVLTVAKTDTVSKNTSTDKKEGRLVLGASQRKPLGSMTINISDRNQTILLLLLYDEDDQIVGKDRIVMNSMNRELDFKKRLAEENSISQDDNQRGKDGVGIIRGIVTENTLTKPGRDFYREYVKAYNLAEINGERVLGVKELLALGSNTQIQLVSGDEIIFQFFVNPRADFIEQMVTYAIRNTNIYFSNLEKNRNLIKKY